MISFKEKIRRVLKFLGWRTIGWFLIGIFSGFLLSLTELSLMAFIQLLMRSLRLTADNVPLPWPLNKIPFEATPLQLCLFLLLVGSFRTIGAFLSSYSAIVAHERINTRLRLIAIYDMLLRPGTKFVSSADMNFRIGEIFPRSASFCFNVASMVPLLIQTIVIGAYMFATAWQEALVGFIGLGAIGVIVLRINSTVRRIAAHVPLEQQTLLKGIERVSRNWLLVRILRTSKAEHQQLRGNIQNYFGHYLGATYWSNIGGNTPSFLGIILLVVIVFINLNFSETPNMAFITFLYAFVKFVQYLGSMATNFGNANSTFPQFKTAFRYFYSFNTEEISAATATPSKKPSQYLAAKDTPSNDTRPLAPKIKIEKLSFSYPGTSKLVLDNLNLLMPAGHQLGIVGRSGSGKSTLLALILGVLKPNIGEVEIDGQIPENYLNLSSVRVGYVGPEPFLIDGTISENLLYGAREIFSDEDLKKALADASLLEYIESLAEGLNYRISENGEGLSAGQKQRLSLARALVIKPLLLVLDEASANLDDRTESEIADSIQKLKGSCTVIIVSHRRGILKYCDRVIEMS